MAHGDKDIRKAIQYAQSRGWTYIEGGKSHRKGVLVCPVLNPVCSISVYGTPQNPTQAAKMIRRQVDKCPHC